MKNAVKVCSREGNVPLEYSLTLLGENELVQDRGVPGCTSTRPPITEGQILLVRTLVEMLDKSAIDILGERD